MHLLALEIDFHILKVDFSIIQRTEAKKINQNYDEEFQIFNYLDAFCRNWHILGNILTDFKFRILRIFFNWTSLFKVKCLYGNSFLLYLPRLNAIRDASQQKPQVANVALHTVGVPWLPGSEGFVIDHVRAHVSQPYRAIVRRRRHEQDLNHDVKWADREYKDWYLPAKCIDCVDDVGLEVMGWSLWTSCE